MGTCTDLHQLVDALPENALPAVRRYLEAVFAGCPPDAPYEDEELSLEEQAMIDASRAAIAGGEAPVSHAELGARRRAPGEGLMPWVPCTMAVPTEAQRRRLCRG